MKKIPSVFRFQFVLITFLLLWSGASALDPDESNFGGMHSLSKYQGSDYSPSSLKSDLDPFIGDYPQMDSLYKIGPGDLFQIFFDASSVEKQVTPEGNIVLNRIGIIHLEGLTLTEAKKIILDNLQASYKRTNCFVNLSKPKTMRIFVTGAVNEPGVHQVPGNFRVSDALKIAKGFSVMAQKGNVRIQAVDGSVQTINLSKFLKEGDLQSNPYLTQGSVIQIPFLDFKQSWATIVRDSGSFIIQLVPGETVRDVIFKSYSLSPSDPYTAILVSEKDGKDTLLSPSEAAIYEPRSEARIEALPSKQKIFVAGAISKPGFIPYHSDYKIIQYISEAGLLTSSKISRKIEVIHKDGRLSLQSVLSPGDAVYVGQNFEQKFLIYTPVILSFVSLTLALLSLNGL